MSWIRDLDNGRYQAVYRDGSKRQRSQTFERKKDARAWLAAQEVSMRAGRWTDPRAGEQLLRDFIVRWQAGREVEWSTEASDRGRVKHHILPALGDWPLNAIRYLDVLEWMQSLKRKGLAPKTRRECLALLKMILDAAVQDGKIPANPAATVKPPPKIKPVQRELTRAEVDKVIHGKAPLSLRARVALAGFGGLRWGEVCGLRQGSLDLTGRRLEVVETMEEVDGHFYRKHYPKDREARTVPITGPLADLLSEHLDTLTVRGVDALVFPSRLGTPIYRSNNDRALDLHAEKAGVRSFNFKDLRRFCASYLINDRGVPVTVVRELLGHSKASMTLDVYTASPTDWHGAVTDAFVSP